jgi:hypothetical protein
VLDLAVNSRDKYLQRLAAKNKNLKPEHIEKLINTGDETVLTNIVKNPIHTKKHLESILDHGIKNDDFYVVSSAIKSPHFNAQHAIQVLKNPQLERLHRDLMNKFGHDENVLDFAVNSGKEHLQSLAAEKKNLKPEHIEKLINTGDETVLTNIVKNPIHTKKHLESILDYGIKNNDFFAVSSAMESPHFTEQHLNKLEQHGSSIFNRLINSYKKGLK